MNKESEIEAAARRGGIASLADEELLYLLLRLGGEKPGSWDQSCRAMRDKGGFYRELRRGNWGFFQESGLDRGQIEALFSALELARRSNYRMLPLSRPFRSSGQIFDYFKPLIADLRKECFWSVLLDGRNRIIRVVRISEGTLTSSLVHPREVFRPAIVESAASMIFVHNHPTGEPDPSPEDISITRRLVEVGRVMGIAVLDHVIMGIGRHFSFADQGLLKEGQEKARGGKK